MFGFIRALASRNRASSIGIAVGVISFIIGVYILLYPVVFTEVLIFLFAIILLIKSIFSLQLSAGTASPTRTWLIISGTFGVIAATLLFILPGIGSIAILYILGIYAVLLGVLGIVDLITLRSKISKMLKGKP
jgi:uncharacterized membrane protein HdeD (DUF308 family)